MNNKIEIYQRKLKEQLTKSNLLDFFYNYDNIEAF